MFLKKENKFLAQSIKGRALTLYFEEIHNAWTETFFYIDLNGVKYDETEIENIIDDGIDFSLLNDSQFKVLYKIFKKNLPYYNPYRVLWKWINRDCIFSLSFLTDFIKIVHNDISKISFWKYFNEYQLEKIMLSQSFLEEYIDFLDLKKLITSINKVNMSNKLKTKIENKLNKLLNEKKTTIDGYNFKLQQIYMKHDKTNEDIEELKETISKDIKGLQIEIDDINFIIQNLKFATC